MQIVNDIEGMRRAFGLAMKGRGLVEPNPMVGCVIARDGEILSEGSHEVNGGPHAEAVALKAIGGVAEGATAYLNLEPCVAFAGKRTVACSEQLTGARVKRVVIGCLDPNPMVAGRGAAMLREAGIEIGPLVLEAEAKQLNAAFFKRVEQHRPYVTLKWAQDAEGRIAGSEGRRVQISNRESMRVTHAMRARCDAILVGIGTVLADDPLLTARRVTTTRKLLRVLVDTQARLPVESRLARTANEFSTVVFAGEQALEERKEHVQELANLGVEVMGTAVESSGNVASKRVAISAVLDELGKREVTHLLIEPGVELARSFLEGNLADRIWVFRSGMKIEGAKCPTASDVGWRVDGDGACVSGTVELGGDVLTEYLNPKGAAFFWLAESADLIAARGR